MPEYETPAESLARQQQRDRVGKVLDQAIRDGVSLKVAMSLDEPPDVVMRWVDALWNGLRDGLSDDHDHPTMRMEDRLTAITMLLEPRMDDQVATILRGLHR